jgi:hypothetical protein
MSRSWATQQRLIGADRAGQADERGETRSIHAGCPCHGARLDVAAQSMRVWVRIVLRRRSVSTPPSRGRTPSPWSQRDDRETDRRDDTRRDLLLDPPGPARRTTQRHQPPADPVRPRHRAGMPRANRELGPHPRTNQNHRNRRCSLMQPFHPRVAHRLPRDENRVQSPSSARIVIAVSSPIP